MGHEKRQDHIFACGSCGERVIVGMEVDLQAIRYKIIWVENVEPHTEEGKIYNLNSEYPVPADQLHSDRAFPWMENAADVYRKQNATIESSGAQKPTFKQMMEDYQGYADRWTHLKKAWSLTTNGRPDLAGPHLARYKLSSGESPSRLSDALYHFSGLILGPWHEILVLNLTSAIQEIHSQNPEQLQEFLRYYSTELHAKHIESTRQVIDDYFHDFSEFKQTLLMVQYDIQISDELVATSSSFARTKMFYGNAFEVLSEHLVIPACLNNMLEGRPYGKFKEMDLRQYLQINKANRGNPFKENVAFAPLLAEFESQLRNASHHASMSISGDGREVTCRNSKTGAKRKFSYAQYVTKCNRIFLSELALFCIDLVFARAVQSKF